MNNHKNPQTEPETQETPEMDASAETADAFDNIEEAAELQAGWFEDAASVGICGATSTPKWLMQQVAEAIRNEELPPSAFGKTCLE